MCSNHNGRSFLDFNIPIRNSTKQVLNALHVNYVVLTPLHGRSNGARRFSFEVREKVLFEFDILIQFSYHEHW